MDTVTVGAGGNVRVAGQQPGTVNARLIPVVDLRMAIATRMRDFDRWHAALGDVVGAVAVGTHGSLDVPALQCLGMNRIQRLGEFDFVTRRTHFVMVDRVLPQVGGAQLTVRVCLDVLVAHGARQVTVDRTLVGGPIEGHVEGLAGLQGRGQAGSVVTGEAGFVVRCILCGGRPNRPEDHENQGGCRRPRQPADRPGNGGLVCLAHARLE